MCQKKVNLEWESGNGRLSGKGHEGQLGGDRNFRRLFSVVDTQMSMAYRRATLKICVFYISFFNLFLLVGG